MLGVLGVLQGTRGASGYSGCLGYSGCFRVLWVLRVSALLWASGAGILCFTVPLGTVTVHSSGGAARVVSPIESLEHSKCVRMSIGSAEAARTEPHLCACTGTLQQREALFSVHGVSLHYSSAQYPEALRCAGAPRAARARARHRRRPERCIVFVIDGTRRHGVLPDRVGVTGSWKLRCSVPSSTACRAVQPSSVPEARRRFLVGA